MQRSLIYQLLARAYRKEPDEEFLVKVASPEVSSVAKVFCPTLDTDAFQITDKVRIEQLAVEFCRLFIGPNPLVPPYESVHRTEPGNSGQFWGDATVKINGIVKTLGLEYAGDFHEMPDHICVEFELMYRLLNLEAECLENNDEVTRATAKSAQNAIFKEHCAIWLPAFCEKVETASNDPFYVALARLTQDFVENERKLF